LIAVAMIVSIVVCGALALTTDWGHVVLVLELALITLFAGFWMLQPVELWTKGLRPTPSASDRTPGV
jgi:hypothetical protein